MKIRKVIFGFGCWMVVGGATAISLGPSRGNVILGAPVDLFFDVQPDQGTDIASSCVKADVAYGDTPVAEAKVRIFPLPEIPGRSSAVRLQVAGVVNEPTISITLTAGCSGKVSRTYTFLADPPVTHVQGSPVLIDTLEPATSAPMRAPAAGAATSRQTPVAPAVVRQVAQPTSQSADSSPAAAPAALKAQPPKLQSTKQSAGPAPSSGAKTAAYKAPERKEAAKVNASPKEPGRSRLVMEPLDGVSKPTVALRPSSDVWAFPPQASASQRQEAAAAWKALNMTQELVLREEERVRTLESEMTAMRAKSSADTAAVTELQQRLALIEQERFSAGVVYALLALLALALGGLAWVWTRARQESRLAMQAWHDSVAVSTQHIDTEEKAPNQVHHDLIPHLHDVWTNEDSTAFSAQAGPVPKKQPPEPATASSVASVSEPTPQPAAQLQPVVALSAHIVNPEEFFDIQQQAEFFVSVGEHEQAVDVLKKHIADHRETSPSAYLELLRLYHTLGRSDDFVRLREEFSNYFNALVPAFSAFNRPGKTLEHYVEALAAIEAEWNSASVLPLLEKLLFRRQGVAVVVPFDLPAYDDLLLLLAIAQTTVETARGATGPRMRTTPLAPPADPLPPEAAALNRQAPASPFAELPLDSLAASLEMEFGHAVAPQQPVAAEAQAEAEAAAPPGSMDLDLDLSEPLHSAMRDLPPLDFSSFPVVPTAGGMGGGQDSGFEEQQPKPKA